MDAGVARSRGPFFDKGYRTPNLGLRGFESTRWALWSRIKVERMPDTNKHDEPYRIPRPQESGYPQKPVSSALKKLLDEWMQGDEKDQRETFELLRRSLDEDRPEGYKLFS